MTKDGCPIGDIAPDQEAQDFVDAFMRFVVCDNDVSKKAIADHYGLFDDMILYTKMDDAVREYRQYLREKDKNKGRK